MIGRKARIFRLIKTVFIILLLILFNLPFFIMINNSFKTTQQFVDDPFSLPTNISIKNYVSAFEKMDFLSGLGNSFVIMTLSVFLIILSSSMAAYFLVRNKWRINKILYAVYVASMIVPFQAIMIPLVSIYGRMQLLNNKWILIFIR